MSKNLRKLCTAAILAALYAAITILSAPLSYGVMQFRLSEALVVLCWFRPWLGIGITLGCLISNVFSTVTALDVIIGTLATVLACLWTARVRRPWLVPLPSIVCNSVLVGAMLAWVLSPEVFWTAFCIYGLQVAVGEAVVLYALGMPLLLFLRNNRTLDRFV